MLVAGFVDPGHLQQSLPEQYYIVLIYKTHLLLIALCQMNQLLCMRVLWLPIATLFLASWLLSFDHTALQQAF